MTKTKINVKQAVKMLGISTVTFYAWKKKYGFNTYIGVGKANLYDKQELVAFKNAPRRKTLKEKKND